jgi:hypothetical protein
MTNSEPGWFKNNETDEERKARQDQAQRDSEQRQRETEEARRALFTAFGLAGLSRQAVLARQGLPRRHR